MKHKRNWVIAIVLSATVAFVGLQTINAPAQYEIVITKTVTIEFVALPSGNCYYIWATKDAPKLTKKIDAQIKAFSENAIAIVTYYGEDCVYEDGRSTFGAMETDFQIRLPVDDLSKDEDFGNWINNVMKIVIEIPREEIQGRYGFVEFWFEKSESENINFRVPIQKYIDEAKDKTGVELFNYFYQP